MSTSGSSKGFWWTLVIIVLLLAVAAAFLAWYLSRGPGEEPSALPVQSADSKASLDGTRGVVLLFLDAEGLKTVTEDRQLPTRGRIEDDVVAIMNALCDGPTTPGAISAIPDGTRARTAFVDRDSGAVVVEFNRKLASAHPGGSAAEYATLTVILSTLAINFPEFTTCSLLVDGAQVETLGGHIQADQPFALRRWR